MTFSIVARSQDGELHGVAVASKFLAAGAAVPAAEAEVGALATQAYANLAFGPQGLTMLRTGASPRETIAALTAGDAGFQQRQLGVVGVAGEGRTFTGTQCPQWAGGRSGEGFCAQGNILTGPEVVDAMVEVWLGRADLEFADRLVAALLAGDRAGGDRRGRQSASVLVVGRGRGYGGTSDTAVDLRVDDHPDPVRELGRLLGLHTLYFGKSKAEDLLPLSGELLDEVKALLAKLGHTADDTDDDLDSAMMDWAGVANLEERLVVGHIDPLVLGHLRTEANP